MYYESVNKEQSAIEPTTKEHSLKSWVGVRVWGGMFTYDYEKNISHILPKIMSHIFLFHMVGLANNGALCYRILQNT